MATERYRATLSVFRVSTFEKSIEKTEATWNQSKTAYWLATSKRPWYVRLESTCLCTDCFSSTSALRGDAVRVFETTLDQSRVAFSFWLGVRSVNYCHRFFLREAVEVFLETSKQRCRFCNRFRTSLRIFLWVNERKKKKKRIKGERLYEASTERVTFIYGCLNVESRQ